MNRNTQKKAIQNGCSGTLEFWHTAHNVRWAHQKWMLLALLHVFNRAISWRRKKALFHLIPLNDARYTRILLLRHRDMAELIQWRWKKKRLPQLFPHFCSAIDAYAEHAIEHFNTGSYEVCTQYTILLVLHFKFTSIKRKQHSKKEQHSIWKIF